MKKIFIIILCLTLCFCLSAPVFAASANAPTFTMSEGCTLISLERIPDEQIESLLPEEIQNAIGSAERDNGSTYGVNKPSESNQWDLDSDGDYHFSANLDIGTIYSNYVFTGHDGNVTFVTQENSGESGFFVITLYAKDGSGYTWHANIQMPRSATNQLGMGNMADNTLFYFGITARNNIQTTLVKSGTYVTDRLYG